MNWREYLGIPETKTVGHDFFIPSRPQVLTPGDLQLGQHVQLVRPEQLPIFAEVAHLIQDEEDPDRYREILMHNLHTGELFPLTKYLAMGYKVIGQYFSESSLHTLSFEIFDPAGWKWEPYEQGWVAKDDKRDISQIPSPDDSGPLRDVSKEYDLGMLNNGEDQIAEAPSKKRYRLHGDRGELFAFPGV